MDLSDYLIISTEITYSINGISKTVSGHKMIHKENGRSYVENFFADRCNVIAIDLIQKYKRQYKIDKDLFIVALHFIETDYQQRKGKPMSRDFLIQEGSAWIKNCEKI